MQESSIYRLILADGEAKGIRTTILRLGRRRLGPPDEAVKSALQAITNLKRLGRISDRVFDAADWADLLSTR